MRILPILFCTFSTLCVANPALASGSDAAVLAHEGDRIVIFQDESQAFAAFATSVLRDPEVASFMSQNFAVLVVVTGSVEARAFPYFGGGRLDPRTVVHSPRLDNMTSFLSPTLSKASFLTVLRAIKQARTMEAAIAATDGGPTAEQLVTWAREYYPAMVEAAATPNGLLLGFLVTRDMRVMKHSAAITTNDASMVQQLRRMLPQAGIPEGTTSGATCFGGLAASEAKYCVTWAVATN